MVTSVEGILLPVLLDNLCQGHQCVCSGADFLGISKGVIVSFIVGDCKLT